MKPIKICYVKCNKFRTFVDSKLFYAFDKALVFSRIYCKCGDNCISDK